MSAASERLPEGRPDSAGLLSELRWRGMLKETTPGLAERLATGRPIAGYNGFDPSAPWLHIGHLVPIFGLVHLQRHGGRPVVVVGGGTGMIGDPSGRSSERNLLDRPTIEANTRSIRGQLEHFLDFSGPQGAVVVDNYDWLSRFGMLEFLRDVGKHFTVPYMLAKDSVQMRLDRGLSFTEFSYMLLQAADFLHLYRTMGVELQMGGADQWGNITAGLELIRRVEEASEAQEPAHALAYPLLLTPSGTKFGKSEAGESVWLDPTQTSPYAFYQYWLNADDRDVGLYLRWFTLFDQGQIESLEAEQAARPEQRLAQRVLAFDITAHVHGAEAAERAAATSREAFDADAAPSAEVLETLYEELDHRFEFARSALADLVGLAIESGLFASRSEVRRAIQQGGLYINERQVREASEPVEALHERWVRVRFGKKRQAIGRLRA
ncbi:MAG: tyrosine--tRNA ligase [Chloroflexi bacterium]|nr:MAG: tyrosine--tRNA ligase [Chloroflexota bacterium]